MTRESLLEGGPLVGGRPLATVSIHAPIDSERERLPTAGLSLSPEEHALLRDPAWMDEGEADGLMSMRREKPHHP